MKTPHFAALMIFLAGCAQDDTRLHGTWRSNRDATVAAAFQCDPRWTNAPPEKLARFRDMFGHLSVTFSNRTMICDYRGEVNSHDYRVVRRGPDFVIIRSDAPLDDERDMRIRFIEGGRSYWIDCGPLGNGLEERFDRVSK